MNGKLAIRRERVAAPVARSVRLLYASDLHLGWPWTRSVAREVLDAVDATRPHALLLGGDLCDGTRALAALAELVRAASASTRVLAVPGNHDLRLGNGLVREALLSAGGAWLVDGEERVEAVWIDGRARPSRPSLGPQSSAPRVLCAHHPRIVEVARRARFDVVLAGHLHGGQFVLFERRGRLYPYAWIDRWCGPRFDMEGTTLLVSRGAGDSLPLRFRCPREVVLCELVPGAPQPADRAAECAEGAADPLARVASAPHAPAHANSWANSGPLPLTSEVSGLDRMEILIRNERAAPRGGRAVVGARAEVQW